MLERSDQFKRVCLCLFLLALLTLTGQGVWAVVGGSSEDLPTRGVPLQDGAARLPRRSGKSLSIQSNRAIEPCLYSAVQGVSLGPNVSDKALNLSILNWGTYRYRWNSIRSLYFVYWRACLFVISCVPSFLRPVIGHGETYHGRLKVLNRAIPLQCGRGACVWAGKIWLTKLLTYSYSTEAQSLSKLNCF